MVALLLLFFLGSFKPAVAMHGKVLRGVQVATSGAVIVTGAKRAYDMNEELKKEVVGTPASLPVQQFVRDRFCELNVPKAKEMPVYFDLTVSSWAVVNDKAVVVNPNVAVSLESSLEGTDDLAQVIASCKKVFGNDCRSVIDGEKAVKALDDLFARDIARNSVVLRHEAHHAINQDAHGTMYAQMVIPIVVQAGCSTVTCGVNKVCGIKSPTKWSWTIMRSGLAVGGIAPKIFFGGVGLLAYMRFFEKRADKGACENAKNDLELKEFYTFFKEIEEPFEKVDLSAIPQWISEDEYNKKHLLRLIHFTRDPVHPYPGDRAAMVQGYIENWDAEHSA